MAFRIALSSVSSSNGLVKNSTAPAFMARTVIGTSPWPVMKMIGMSVRSAAIRFCKSKPLRSGRLTSSTRQLGTLLEQARTDRLVSEGCDEHDRNLLPAKHQLALEIRAGHARHGDVEDQALGLPDGIGREEFLCRREHRDRKAEFAQQVRQRLAHGLVVIDDRNQWMHNHHILLVRCCAPVARSPALGMENENVAPGPSSFGAAHRRPRCRSMMKRLTDKPMPMPSLLVV